MNSFNAVCGQLLDESDGYFVLQFTEPWEPIIVRRGDALGLAPLTDQFADAVAPDLSNRIIDGRWVTILAWCLARSHQAFHAAGGHAIETRRDQRMRYAWLRPLELMWVARTLVLTENALGRPVNGVRSVQRWCENERLNRFGMSEAQFRAYRQTGIYGGYRLAFRKWPGMTLDGDGWTPGPAVGRLANWLDFRLRLAKPAWALHDDGDDLPETRRFRDKEFRWWLRNWNNFREGGKQAEALTLPRPRNEFAPLAEASLLTPLIYGQDPHGRRRLAVAKAVASAKAKTHLDVCCSLAKSFPENSAIEAMPRFSALADAGMVAMDLIAGVLGDNPDVDLATVARDPRAPSVCNTLSSAAKAWLSGQIPPLRHTERANRLAEAVSNGQPMQCLAALLRHHEYLGGGLRWFVLREGRVQARSPARLGSARYGFRLWSLCRLAVQCGVIAKMPKSLDRDQEEASDNE